jgi:hypothetical protein
MFRNGRVGLAVMIVSVATLAMPTVAQALEIRFRADLFPTPADPNAGGRADWVLDTETSIVRLNIQVEDVATTNLARAFVNNRFVGFIIISNGSGELELDTSLGDAVPRVKSGTSAVIRRSSDNVIILAGIFVQR